MQFKVAFATLVSVLSFVVASPTDLSESKVARAVDGDTNFFFCVDAFFRGDCDTLTVNSDACTAVPLAFNDLISSVRPDPGWVCIVYTDFGCAGDSVAIASPGTNFLGNAGPFNDVVSSFRCNRLFSGN